MEPVERRTDGGITTLALSRGKVNALNGDTVASLRAHLRDAERDAATRAVILTGTGKFFSFGFDVPELYGYTRDAFTGFVTEFTSLYRELFACPKPVVAAINGHAVAGGCMLALACDWRVMTSERATIGLNEITFGASVFAGSAGMLQFWTGQAAASKILLSGSLYGAAEALSLGLIDAPVPPADVESTGRAEALSRAAAAQPAYGALKDLLRRPILEEMTRREAAMNARFVEIWYSEETRRAVEKIAIR